MPPNSTRCSLTFGSSVRVGVYTGTRCTSCPCASSSAASALSRKQLPQYIPAAPAVIERIFMEPPPSHRLEGPRPEQELDDVAFVRLHPVQAGRRHRPEVEAIDVDGVEQLAPQARRARQRRTHERRTDRFHHLRLGALDDGDEGEHEFLP